MHGHYGIRTCKPMFSSKTLLGLYYSMVDLFLVYGNIVWTANYQTRLNCLTLLQKRTLRVITRDTYYAHTEAKFLELGILKFININIYLIGNFVYRLCNNLLPLYFNFFVIKIHVVHDHYTRSRDNF